MSAVMDDIHLVGEQIFDHTTLIRKQIDKFLDNFERNERHKEFDGIIRASHTLVEAADAPLEKVLVQDELRKLNEQIKKTTVALSALTFPTYQKEHDDYLEAIRKSQQEQKAVVEAAVERQRQAILHGSSTIPYGPLSSPDMSNTTEVRLD